jgi:hypothetical protein
LAVNPPDCDRVNQPLSSSKLCAKPFYLFSEGLGLTQEKQAHRTDSSAPAVVVQQRRK